MQEATDDYLNAMFAVVRNQIRLLGRLPIGKFGASDEVFIAVATRLRFSLGFGIKDNSMWGRLEDAILLSVEKGYAVKRKDGQFDIDDWYAFVDTTVVDCEAEVYLWWRTHQLEKFSSPERLSARIALLETVMQADVGDDLISALMGLD